MSSYKVKKKSPQAQPRLASSWLYCSCRGKEEKQQANKCEQVLNSLSDMHSSILTLKNSHSQAKKALKVAAEHSCQGATSTYISLWITSDYSSDHLLL